MCFKLVILNLNVYFTAIYGEFVAQVDFDVFCSDSSDEWLLSKHIVLFYCVTNANAEKQFLF